MTTRDDTGARAQDARLIAVRDETNVLEVYRGTSVEDLLLAQNLGRPFPVGGSSALLVATCIDSRVRFALPPGAAFELRAAGVNLGEEAFFQIAYAVAARGVRHLALVSHEDCAMSTLESQHKAFVEGMELRSDWTAAQAEAFFREHALSWQQDDPDRTVVEHARDLRERFPSITIAPLHYAVSDGRLSQIDERAGW